MRCIASMVAVLVALIPAAVWAERTDLSVVGFTGRLSQNTIDEIVTADDVGMRDAYLVGAGVTKRLWSWQDMVDLEAEGQITRHFGNEDNWQVNGAIGPRWTEFPWNDTAPTSVAYLLGLSLASRTPSEERVLKGSSNRLLVYWLAEVEVGLPDQPWAAIFRIHHRSTGLGEVFENGGSNWFVLGVRRFF